MEIKEESFKHSVPIQIRFSDIDAIGHINNNIYFSYFDLGKVHYFEELRASAVSWIEGIVVVAHLETDFFSPIYYKEQIAVDTKVLKIGTKSITILQQLRSIKTQEIKCRCTSVIVAYEAKLQASMDIPAEWKEVISVYEGLGN